MKDCRNEGLSMKVRVRLLPGFALLLGLFALGQQHDAFAQAGSTGGTIGKQNKETSGDTISPEGKTRALSPRPRETEGGRITVISATLGANCGVSRGNVTSRVAEICNGQEACQLPGSRVNNPDPAFGCGKAFEAQWKCSAGGKPKSAAVAGSSFETNVLTLKCN
jgi:hypothetical protein